MIYVYKNKDKKYKCTPPDEQRVTVFPQGRQWVLDFTICDAITAAELDELLDTNSLSFEYCDDSTGALQNTLTFEGYTKINGAYIKYEQDLSCTAPIQLGKEITNNASKI